MAQKHNSVAMKESTLQQEEMETPPGFVTTFINKSCLTTADVLMILNDMNCGAQSDGVQSHPALHTGW